jgi:hypothetical protein
MNLEGTMVSKCANPRCNVTFLYFHSGQLFRFETSARDTAQARDIDEMKKPVRRLEFFWLCDDCARNLTLGFKKEVGVFVRPKFVQVAGAA